MSRFPAAYAAAPRWAFGDSPELADELLALVLAGGKRATCSSLASCEADIMPSVGGISVILDGAGAPRCVIRTTEVEVMPFEQVSEDFARAEGEGDLTYAWWRDAHEAYYRREGSWAPGMKVETDPAVLNQLFETLEDWNACLASLPDLPIAEESPPQAPARRKPPAPSI